jgi:putative drug exporter of the RND superfamily
VIEEVGSASGDRALNDTIAQDLQRAGYLSLPVTLAILLVAFGAAVAAGIPVLLALSGVLGTLGLAALVSRIVPEGSPTASVIFMIGMAVGVDYSLFYLRRWREERVAGREPAADHRWDRDQRGRRDGGGVRHLHHRTHPRPEADGAGAGRRGPP